MFRDHKPADASLIYDVR